MARLFTAASSQYVERTSALFTTWPATVAGWVYLTTLGVEHALFTINNGTTTPFGLFKLGLGTNNKPIFYLEIASNGYVTETASATCSINTWHHIAAVWTSRTSRKIYLDGGSMVETTTTSPASSMVVSRTSIGRQFYAGSAGAYLDGRAAEVGVWNIDLTNAQIASLAARKSPLSIRRDKLISYWKLKDNDADRDWYGKNHLTAANSPTHAHHPGGIIYPGSF